MESADEINANFIIMTAFKYQKCNIYIYIYIYIYIFTFSLELKNTKLKLDFLYL